MDQGSPGTPQDGGDSRDPAPEAVFPDGPVSPVGPGGLDGRGETQAEGDLPGQAGQALHAAVAALEAARAAVEALAAVPLWSLSDAQSREMTAGRFTLEQQLHAGYLASLVDLDSRPGVVPRARPGTQARTFGVHVLRRSPAQAGADVRAARTLAPGADPAAGGLPRLGAALAAGEISREHAQAGVRAIRRLPKDLLAAPLDDEPGISPRPARPAGPANPGCVTGPASSGPASSGPGAAGSGGAAEARGGWCRGDLVDHLLTEYSKTNDPGTVDRLAQYMLNAADPDGSHSFDPKAAQRRGLSLVTDQTGMGSCAENSTRPPPRTSAQPWTPTPAPTPHGPRPQTTGP